MHNEVINTIFTRSSVRAYKNEQLTQDMIDTLAKVALASPTAMNAQTQRFYFVTNKELIGEWERLVADAMMKNASEEMKEKMKQRGGKVFYNAPLVIVVAVDKKNKFSMIDSGIAIGELAIAAKSMGLDSVILGMPALVFDGGEKGEQLKEKLGIDKNLDFAIAISIGFADMSKEPHESNPNHIIYVK